MIENLQFLNPLWFLVIFLLIAVLFYKGAIWFKKTNFSKICDSHLVQFLTQVQPLNYQQKNIKTIPTPFWKKAHFFFQSGLFLVGLMLTISLATPVWEKLPTPVFENGYQSVVIVLDLSQSMNAKDVLPSRLERAKFKIQEILKKAQALEKEDNSQNNSTQENSIVKKNNPIEIGLVVYSNQAYVVSPITNHTESIEPLLDALNTELMPSDGSRLQRGINKANELLNQAEIEKGNILIITDSVESANFREVQKITPFHRIHLLGVGTPEGAVIPYSNGTLVKDQNGQAVIAKVNLELMRSFFRISGGHFEMMSFDDQDITHILNSLQSNNEVSFTLREENVDTYHQEYFWFLLVAMAIFLTYFRKGVLVFIAIPVFFSPIDLRAETNVTPNQEVINNIFYSKDWNGEKNFHSENYDAAVNQFENLRWKASSFYKKGEYQKALELWQKFHEADDFYNQGNSYAALGEYQKAIKSYDSAIAKDENHSKAIENKKRVLDFLKNQQNKQKKNNQNNQQNKQNSSGSEQNQSQNNNSDGKNNDNQQSSQGEKNSKANQQDQQKQPRQSPQSEVSNQQNQSDKNQKNDAKQGNEKNQIPSQQQGENQSNAEQNAQKTEQNDPSNSSANKQNNNNTQNQAKNQAQPQNEPELDPSKVDEKVGKQQIQASPTQSNDNDLDKDTKQLEEKSSREGGNKRGENNQNEVQIDRQENQNTLPFQVNPEFTEKQIYIKQQLQQIKDDPGELLRRKFLYQYKKNENKTNILDQPY